MAEDTGLSPLADRTEVEISIVDVNDNAPRFSSVHYHGSVHENVPAGTSILEVRTHHMFLRILIFLFVIVFSSKKIVFSIKNMTVILAFYKLNKCLNENSYRTVQSK